MTKELPDLMYKDFGEYLKRLGKFLKDKAQIFRGKNDGRLALRTLFLSMLANMFESDSAYNQNLENGYFTSPNDQIYFVSVRTNEPNPQKPLVDFFVYTFEKSHRDAKSKNIDLDYYYYYDLVKIVQNDYPTVLINGKLPKAKVVNTDSEFQLKTFSKIIRQEDIKSFDHRTGPREPKAFKLQSFQNDKNLDFTRYDITQPIDPNQPLFGQDYFDNVKNLRDRLPLRWQSSENALYASGIGGLMNWLEKWQIEVSFDALLNKIRHVEIEANVYDPTTATQSKTIRTYVKVEGETNNWRRAAELIIAKPIASLKPKSDDSETALQLVKIKKLGTYATEIAIDFDAVEQKNVKAESLADKLMSSESLDHLEVKIRDEISRLLAEHGSLEKANVELFVKLMQFSKEANVVAVDPVVLHDVAEGMFGDSLYLLKSDYKTIVLSLSETPVDYELLYTYISENRHTWKLYGDIQFVMVGTVTDEAYSRYVDFHGPEKIMPTIVENLGQNLVGATKKTYKLTKKFFSNLLTKAASSTTGQSTRDLFFVETARIENWLPEPERLFPRIPPKIQHLNYIHGNLYQPQPESTMISYKGPVTDNLIEVLTPDYTYLLDESFQTPVKPADVEMIISNIIRLTGLLIDLHNSDILSLVIKSSLKTFFEVETHPDDAQLIGVKMRYKKHVTTKDVKPKIFWFKMAKVVEKSEVDFLTKNMKKTNVKSMPDYKIFFLNDDLEMFESCLV